MKRFVCNPHSGLILGSMCATLVTVAVLFLGAPPIILIPAGLITATIQLQLQAWVRRQHDGR